MADTSVNYTCPSCNAPLSFKPGASKVSCEYCGAQIDMQAMEEMFAEKEAAAAAAQAAKESKWQTGGSEAWEAEEAAMMTAFTCSSCGAEIVADRNTMATECCYCGNPTMLPNRFEGMARPDLVIPFKKTKEEAVAALKDFYKGKRLLPDAFTANNRVEDIQPMYVPFWLFDVAVEADATYRASNTETTSTADEIITHTSYYRCTRTGQMKFERIPVDGSEKMDDAFMESIEPFDYSELVPFTPAYMTGYLADKYDVDAERAGRRADERLETSAEGKLRETVTGYDHVEIDGGTTVLKEDNAVKYVLAPVWILTTKYEGKPYTFMLNGQTGKMVGSLPIDKGKLMKYTVGTMAASFAVIFALAQVIFG